jgi:ATP-dependent Clp protease ATP-binding subunit ClpA
VNVFERFTGPADQVMCLAYEEADRLRHDYVGPEHVLAGLGRQELGRTSGILQAAGLNVEAIRAQLDRLVDAGMLPGPWRSNSELLHTLGVDLSAVRRAVEDTFGSEAVCAAHRRVLGRSRLREDRIVCGSPLSGKAMLAKRALSLASKEADGMGQDDIGPEHVLLGVLRDAQDPLGSPRPGRRIRRIRAHLGLPQHGPSPVRLVIEASGTTLHALRGEVLAELHASS